MSTVVNDEMCRSGAPNASPQSGGDGDTAAGPDGDDLVRPGDEHVNSTESLCVGESQ